MNVLSLFDGMSCTQIALKNLGIKVDKYYASEIDKYAIKVTRENFPETIHLGDIKDITGSDFIYDIDLIVAGSPCQGFSFAGKQLAFDDPRSALFFEFVRLLREVKPKYFLLENVRMKKEFQDVISQQVSDIYPECNNGSLFGIEPIKINSALVSAQSRNRLYWTNIPNIEQPKDLGIVLRDILEPSEDWGERPQYLKNEFAGRERGSLVKDIDEKSACLNATMYKGQISSYVKKRAHEDLKKMTTKDGKAFVLTASYQGAASWNSIERKQRTMVPTYDKPKKVGTATDIKGYDIIKRVYSEDGKSPTLTTMGGGHREPKVAVKGGALRARSKNKEGKNVEWKKTKPQQMLELRKDDKSNSLTSSTKDSLAVKEEELTWRKLTPLECERLQTLPDKYTEGVSNTQRYNSIGNGWTVDIISHIFRNIK